MIIPGLRSSVFTVETFAGEIRVTKVVPVMYLGNQEKWEKRVVATYGWRERTLYVYPGDAHLFEGVTETNVVILRNPRADHPPVGAVCNGNTSTSGGGGFGVDWMSACGF